ncbi:alpha/beta fold hydrolase [Yinghuangia aomiensis]
MKTTDKPVIVLVHGAFAESASWNRVIRLLNDSDLRTVAAANPLRGLAEDAAYLRDVVEGIDRPVVLVGHSYGGMVITQAAADLPAVRSLVYVGVRPRRPASPPSICPPSSPAARCVRC